MAPVVGQLTDDDEDGDGTAFDRLLGISGITATSMNPACGFNQPIFGNVSAYFPAECVDEVDLTTAGFVMDPSGTYATWGNFLTAHAVIFQQCSNVSNQDDDLNIIPFLGWEWTQTSIKRNEHYGHKNIIIKNIGVISYLLNNVISPFIIKF